MGIGKWRTGGADAISQWAVCQNMGVVQRQTGMFCALDLINQFWRNLIKYVLSEINVSRFAWRAVVLATTVLKHTIYGNFGNCSPAGPEIRA
jgi:hypothetical protein